jgi:hypothetical protein
MSPINYGEMSDQELRQYFLNNRNDQAAFYAYMDRRHARPNQVAIEPDDPNAEEKFRLMVEEKLAQREIN